MDKLTKKGLDGTQLKTIALVLMVLDHIHYFFEFTGCIPTVRSEEHTSELQSHA